MTASRLSADTTREADVDHGAAPDVAAPDVAAPDVAAPDVAAPDAVAPDAVAPDGVAPDGVLEPVARAFGVGCSAGTLRQLMSRAGFHPVLLAGSRDPNAKLTLMLIDGLGPAFAVKVATTPASAEIVRAEGELLHRLHALGLGSLGGTVPRPVGFVDADGLPALVTGGLTGTPMAVGYHEWRHTARRRRVRADFAAAGQWLSRLRRHSARDAQPVTFLDDALDAIEQRFGEQVEMRERLIPFTELLSRQATPRTVVHGDYWFGNVLIDGDQVVGVVDWESSVLSGEPLRDVARFAVSYSLYLDRHVRPGAKLPGHRGVRADTWGVGALHAMNGRGWYPDAVRAFCRSALIELGADPACARAVLVAGIAEVAATADHPDFARAHLQLLTGLASEPGGTRR
jgi:hypothetical protein